MPTSSIRPLALSGLLAGAVVVFLGAQTQTPPEKPQDPAQQPPKFRVEANFVRVDAYPLKDGKPVLDLKAEDFEVFEDGVAQKIESFEHVVVRPAGPQDGRVEVSSQRESQQAAANPRNRVFVIFIDTPHIQFASRNAITEPLIRLMNRILGPDDLVGIMTPEMAASQVVLGRKTQVIEDSLRKNWVWGTRDMNLRDERETAYDICYPPKPGEGIESAVTREMIARKRERATLDALEDLVRYLRTIREERKAILTITEGWLLYGENPKLIEGATEDGRVPGIDPITVGPNGKLTTKDPRDISRGPLNPSECDGDRMRLAMMDDRQFFLDLMNEANAGNASFYPVDPRGLAVFDTAIGPDQAPSIVADMGLLKRRLDTLKTLAGNTDGIAVTDSNDLDKGLQRISDDLTSYYLMGYLSTNSRLDGKFRTSQGQGQAAGNRGPRPSWLPGGDGNGSLCSAPSGGRPGPGGHARGQPGTRAAGPRAIGRPVPDQCREQRRQQAAALGRGRTAGNCRTAGRVRARWNRRDRSHRRLVVHDHEGSLEAGRAHVPRGDAIARRGHRRAQHPRATRRNRRDCPPVVGRATNRNGLVRPAAAALQARRDDRQSHAAGGKSAVQQNGAPAARVAG